VRPLLPTWMPRRWAALAWVLRLLLGAVPTAGDVDDQYDGASSPPLRTTPGGVALPRRLQQARRPQQLVLPFPDNALCEPGPQKCFLHLPASAFPSEIYESQEQLTMHYSELMQAIRSSHGLAPASVLTLTQFVIYCRDVAATSAETSASINSFDPPDSHGRPSCDIAGVQVAAGTNGDPGVSDACLLWMQIFKVFLFYEAELPWASTRLAGVGPGWCAQRVPLPNGGGCPEPGQCWPECASVMRKPQPGLLPRWCDPWPRCSANDPTFDSDDGDPNDRVLRHLVVGIMIAFVMRLLDYVVPALRQKSGGNLLRVGSDEPANLRSSILEGDVKTTYWTAEESMAPRAWVHLMTVGLIESCTAHSIQ
jgi:hypothetical protein